MVLALILAGSGLKGGMSACMESMMWHERFLFHVV